MYILNRREIQTQENVRPSWDWSIFIC